MVDGITLRAAHYPHSPPDHVMQVAVMVRSLSNKYVPVPSLDEIEIDLQASLKDFRHRCRKRAAAVALREHTDPPSSQLQTTPTEASQSTERSDADSWREPVQPDPPLDDGASAPTSMTRFRPILKCQATIIGWNTFWTS